MCASSVSCGRCAGSGFSCGSGAFAAVVLAVVFGAARWGAALAWALPGATFLAAGLPEGSWAEAETKAVATHTVARMAALLENVGITSVSVSVSQV
jgi:hypothetical protein